MALASDFVEMCICQGAGENGGMTNSFGSHEESGWRQGGMDGGGEKGWR